MEVIKLDITPERKRYIDSLSYEQLLYQWRYAPVGSPWFQSETGEYWRERMKELRSQGADHTEASKSIGWNG